MTAELVVGVSLPISGSLSIQGRQVQRGLELWRRRAEVERRREIHLHVLDDRSSSRRARTNAERLLEEEVDLLFGPYGGAAGRAVASLAGQSGVLIWNHSSSDDEVARRYVVTLPTPASKYLVGAVDLAFQRGCSHALIAASNTRFGAAVARGAKHCATAHGIGVTVLYIPPGRWKSRRSEIVSRAARRNLIALCGGLRDDIETVAALRDHDKQASVIAAVGAGVQEFGRALKSGAQGVIGPSQWEPDDSPVDIGPTALRDGDCLPRSLRLLTRLPCDPGVGLWRAGRGSDRSRGNRAGGPLEVGRAFRRAHRLRHVQTRAGRPPSWASAAARTVGYQGTPRAHIVDRRFSRLAGRAGATPQGR